mgnify:CR=1 FL=1
MGRLCGASSKVPCAHPVALAHICSLMDMGFDTDEDSFFCPMASVIKATKAAAIAAFTYNATARVTGAHFLARIGMELLLIQLQAKWESQVIMPYVRKAPLLALTATARENME